ncbi:MAG: hypothetical protein ETSY1_09045 [Candidatus Entotheonella factor]|uniref:NfeD-like C-terminal domain-containing protein n=1 Tax=Entotheonella factor TaxID=1429438 RepID=W4LT43_ENTF1|nr:hypothetical protein [Candidatus Entotheonella palauensis]ETX01035.1 MAG: hypothetical protein ETSY1_09045 [Candidatus Entotheonella factor]
MGSLAVILHNLYIFATIFGIGFLVVDLLGILGTGDDGGDAQGAGGEEASGGILNVLRYFRTFLYFCAGFGPTGLVAGLFGYSTWPRLGWGLAAGIVAALVARALFRLQHQELDSTVSQHDLLAERAVVTVPIPKGQMGKVRLRMGPVVVERFAIAADPSETFEREEMVQIIEVQDDCVKVEKYQGARSLDETWWREIDPEGDVQ